MAVTPFKTFMAGEVLTASDLNSSITRITDNGEDLPFPATKAKDFNGHELILDADADSSITCDTDDVFHLKLQGQDLFIVNGATSSAVNGLTVTASATTADVAMTTHGSDTNIDLAITPKGAGVLLLDGAQVGGTATTDLPLISQILGKHTIWVPASAMFPQTTNGCAPITQVELTANQPELMVLDFDASADEWAQFTVKFPKSWNEGVIQYRVFWTTTATDTDGVAWQLSGVARADNEAVAAAFGTAVVVTDDAQGAASEMLVTAFSGDVTISSAAADEVTWLRIGRDVSDANDDMTEDARLIGVEITYTIDALNDS